MKLFSYHIAVDHRNRKIPSRHALRKMLCSPFRVYKDDRGGDGKALVDVAQRVQLLLLFHTVDIILNKTQLDNKYIEKYNIKHLTFSMEETLTLCFGRVALNGFRRKLRKIFSVSSQIVAETQTTCTSVGSILNNSFTCSQNPSETNSSASSRISNLTLAVSSRDLLTRSSMRPGVPQTMWQPSSSCWRFPLTEIPPIQRADLTFMWTPSCSRRNMKK